jgi:hypothetical protein
MNDTRNFAIVITNVGKSGSVVDAPWLETEYHIDESDWMVLSEDGWTAVADGEPTIWEALERKLLIGFYMSQPRLIAVIGHPSADDTLAAVDQRKAQVRHIVDRIRALLLPVGVLGLWTDEQGVLQDVLEPARAGEWESPEPQLAY